MTNTSVHALLNSSAPIEPQPFAHIKAVLARLKQAEVNNRVVLKVAQ